MAPRAVDLVYYFQLGHTREVLGRATLDIARSVKVEEGRGPHRREAPRGGGDGGLKQKARRGEE